jgi:hypothetical protein
VDTDNIQSGDQTSPDTATTRVKATAKGTKAESLKAASAPAGDESSSESDGENSASNDGPGGHQDTPGVDVNHEFNG